MPLFVRCTLALALAFMPTLALAQAHQFHSGGQLTPRGAAPVATSGNGIIWADKNAANALIYTNPAGTKFNLSLFPSTLAGAKGSLLAHSGSAWGALTVGTNGQCLVADSTQTLGVKWSSCGGGGGGSGTMQDAYDASSAPVVIAEDNTRGTFALKANAAGDPILAYYDNADTFVGGVGPDGALIASSIESPTIGTDGANQHALPSGTGDLVSTNAAQTLIGKTLDRLDVTGTSTANSIVSGVANGGSAVANILDTSSAYTTTGAKLLSLRTNGAEFWSIAKTAFGWAINAPSSRFLEFHGSGGSRFGSTSYYFAENWNIVGGLELVASTASYQAVSTAFQPNGDATLDSGASSKRWKINWTRTTVVGDTSANQPTCNSTNRGAMYVVRGSAGVADTFQVCLKDASDAYAWVTK